MEIEPLQHQKPVDEAWLDRLLALIPHIVMTDVEATNQIKLSLQNLGPHPKISVII